MNKHKAIPIAAVSLLLGLVFDWLFWGKVPGISIFAYTVLIFGVTFGLIKEFRNPINKSLYWLVPVTLFFSFMVLLRANPLLIFIDICMTIYTLMLVARLIQRPAFRLKQFEILDYFTFAINTPLTVLQRSGQFLLSSLSTRNVTSPKSSYVPIIRGVLLSLPIVFIFLLLLSSADLVFKHYVTSLISFHISGETVARLILIGFVASIFIGAYAYIFMPAYTPENPLVPPVKKLGLGATEATIILGSVSTLFLLFVLVQFAYLFGGKDHIVSGGYTYADYARKGFFELIAVAAISLALIQSVKKSVVFQNITQAKTFKWLSGILIAEVMIIMLSAHMRLNLYEDAYGYTALRLWSHLFIAWLAFAFLLRLYHIITEKDEKNFAFQLFISVLCLCAVINLINPDSFIARQNISRFNDTGKLDLNYLGDLSLDATPAIATLLNNHDVRVQKSAANILYRQKVRQPDTQSHWQSENVARERANKIFRNNAAKIDAASDYFEYPALNGK